jgi:ABC-type multidrug transport system ATPase subunit
MNIKVQGLGKRYRQEWIFKGLDFDFQAGQCYALTGFNGSGKSTLLQILSGYLSPSQGHIEFVQNDQVLEPGQVYAYLGYAAPYIELIEELSLLEALQFHQQFKPWWAGLDQKAVLDLLQFPKNTQHKALRYFSSGMKQRLKLLLAICSQSSLLLLDEPSITLDRQGVAWYRQLLEQYAFQPQRLCIIASNVEEDYQGAQQILDVTQYKK